MSTVNMQTLATGLNTVITRLGRRIRRIDDRQDIGRARLSALSVLVFGGPSTLSELAADEMVSPATMHHVVNGLITLKFARKKPDRTDKRRSTIEATKAGHRFMEQARQARLDFYIGKLEALTDRERKVVADFVLLANPWYI